MDLPVASSSFQGSETKRLTLQPGEKKALEDPNAPHQVSGRDRSGTQVAPGLWDRVSAQPGFYSNTTCLPRETTLGTDSWFPYSFTFTSNQIAGPVNCLTPYKGNCSLKVSVML